MVTVGPEPRAEARVLEGVHGAVVGVVLEASTVQW